jgi:hypothetical protein
MKMGTAAEGNCFSCLRAQKAAHTRRVGRNNIFISIQVCRKTETHFTVVRNQFQLMKSVQVVRWWWPLSVAQSDTPHRARPFGALGAGKIHLSPSCVYSLSRVFLFVCRLRANATFQFSARESEQRSSQSTSKANRALPHRPLTPTAPYACWPT